MHYWALWGAHSVDLCFLLTFIFVLIFSLTFELLGQSPPGGRADPRVIDRMLDVTQPCLLNKAEPALIVSGISAQSPVKHTL